MARTLVDDFRERDAAKTNGDAARLPKALPPARDPRPAPRPKAPSLRQPPPYVPFPVDALPQPLSRFAVDSAAALGTDVCFLALPALAAAASLIGNTRCIRIKRGWTEPPVLWVALVGDSGSLKSPALRAALAPVYRLQDTLTSTYEQATAAHRREREEYGRRKKDYERSRRDRHKPQGKPGDKPAPPPPPPGDAPEKPPCERLVCSDVTIERLGALLADNPRGLLLSRDELGAWLASFDRYKSKGAAGDLPHWMELHQAGTLFIDRQGGDRQFLCVRRASVSVVGGIQPGTLRHALTPAYREAGLAARLLLGMPPRRPKTWTGREVDPEVTAAYESLLARLSKLPFHVDSERLQVPFAVKMSPEAHALWVEFYNSWAQEQAAAEGELASAFSKLEAYCARLTLIHHVVTQAGVGGDDCDPIEPASVEAGIRLARWFGEECRRIYGTLSESEEETRLRRLAEFVGGRGGEVTARALQRSNPARYQSAEQAEAALSALAEAGAGVWVDRPPDAQGGRPTRTFRMHPTPDKTDKTPPAGDPAEGGADTTPDKTPDKTPGTATNPNVSGGFVSFVRRRVQNEAPAQPSAQPPGGKGPPEVSSGDEVRPKALGFGEDLRTPFDEAPP